MHIYFGAYAKAWNGTPVNGRDAIEDDFSVELGTSVQVLFAAYEADNSWGSDSRAMILYRQYDRLYLVEATGDSMSGLLGQWEPDQVIVPQLKMMVLDRNYWSQETIDGWNAVIASLK